MSKDKLYQNYVSSGQAGVDPEHPIEHAKRKLGNANPYCDRLLEHYKHVDRNGCILDIGCGHGKFLAYLKRHGFQNVSGIDASTEQVELAHALGIHEVEHGDAIEFLERQSAVSVISCFDLIEHLSLDDTLKLLQRAHAALEDSGILLLHIPNGEGLFGQRIRYGDLTHETCFTPRSINQLLSSAGYIEISCFEDKPIPHGLKSTVRRLIWELGTLWPRVLLSAETGSRGFVLSQNMLVIARKQSSTASDIQ